MLPARAAPAPAPAAMAMSWLGCCLSCCVSCWRGIRRNGSRLPISCGGQRRGTCASATAGRLRTPTGRRRSATSAVRASATGARTAISGCAAAPWRYCRQVWWGSSAAPAAGLTWRRTWRIRAVATSSPRCRRRCGSWGEGEGGRTGGRASMATGGAENWRPDRREGGTDLAKLRRPRQHTLRPNFEVFFVDDDWKLQVVLIHSAFGFVPQRTDPQCPCWGYEQTVHEDRIRNTPRCGTSPFDLVPVDQVPSACRSGPLSNAGGSRRTPCRTSRV